MCFLLLTLIGSVKPEGLEGILWGTNKETERYVDIVVVGGGIGGTYTAWRLQSHYNELEKLGNKRPSIEIFERTDRIGGRFYSPTIGGCNKLKLTEQPRCELGGMRIENNQNLIRNVVRQLRIKTGPFLLNAENKNAQDDDNNPVFFRGQKHIKSRKWAYDISAKDEHNLPYAFNEYEEVGIPDDKTDESLYGYQPYSYYNIFPLSTPVNYCDPKNANTFYQKLKGLPAYKWQYDTIGLPRTNTSKEGINFAADLSGYSDLFMATIPPAARDVLPPDESQISRYIRPLLGMQDIPLRLNDAFQYVGGKTRINMELVSVSIITRKNSSKPHYKLYFAKTYTNPCTGITTVVENEDPVVIHTGRLILAGIPTNALTGIFTPQNGGLKVIQAVHNLVLDVRPFFFGKFFFAYDGPLPELNLTDESNLQWEVGRYTSSTELDQIFKWYPGTQFTPKSKSCNVTVLQVYSADPALQSFSQSIGRDFYVDAEKDKYAQEAMGCRVGDSRTMIDGFVDVINKMVALHLNVSVEDLPKMLEVKHHSWARNDPRTQQYSFHTWKGGVKWWESFEKSLQPVASEHIHIVGDTFSVLQGWGEGALISAEYMMQEKMNIPSPKWLPKREYCKLNPFYPKRRNNRREDELEPTV